nr:MAG TPA_asm: hypothetical protein [Caudoviricetes sp.]DAL61277.1 MAG TPA_asm: hypothetical protein [Bacteriophage sp.]
MIIYHMNKLQRLDRNIVHSSEWKWVALNR